MGVFWSITSVSRVLYWTVIYLGRTSPHASLPPVKLPSKLKTLRWVLLRIGFTWPCSLLHAGELLPRLSILTAQKTRRYLSVALALKSPSADVICYPALRSPDFPHFCGLPQPRDCLEWWIFIITHKFYFVNLLIIFCLQYII